MKLSDYVIDFFAKRGVKYNFLISGGAVIHLVDSTRKHPDMEYICTQHEQGAAAAADMYARVSGNLGLTMTTSGPGATNILTSVCNAYFDSIPMICVTGQVARFRIRKSTKLRQRGFQETDVVAVFSPITKYAQLVLDPLMIRYELEKAVYLAQEGRPGPVLLDIPDDLQRVEIDPEALEGFVPPHKEDLDLTCKIEELLAMIESAARPVIILGAGVHCAKAEEMARAFVHFFKIPVALTWGGADLLAHADPLNIGCVGVCGPRAGNLALQHADLIIAMGTRLSQMVTGGKQDLFAPHAQKVMVDIDPEEAVKFGPETFCLDLFIQTDLKAFFEGFQKLKMQEPIDRLSHWRESIHGWHKRYPICPESYYAKVARVNPYVFIKELSKVCKEGDQIISDTGANVSWTMQAFETKKNQRLYSAWNNTPMGYSLPASVGAALATDAQIICIIGDGGLMMCVEELGTVRRHDLPIKIFLFNNRGHGIQKQTIDTWLHSKYAAVDQATGLYFPDYQKIAEAFHLPYVCLKEHSDLRDKIQEVMKLDGPVFCDVEMIENQKIVPMLKFGSGLEDLDPRLSTEELATIAAECSIPELVTTS